MDYDDQVTFKCLSKITLVLHRITLSKLCITKVHIQVIHIATYQHLLLNKLCTENAKLKKYLFFANVLS
jgi:hypothetical protein